MEVTRNPFGEPQESHEVAARRALHGLAIVLGVAAGITRDDLGAAGATIVLLALLAPRGASGPHGEDDDGGSDVWPGMGGLAAVAERALPAGLFAAGVYLIIGNPKHVIAAPVIWLVATLGAYSWDRLAGDGDRPDPARPAEVIEYRPLRGG